MIRRQVAGLGALATAVALILAGCGGSGGSAGQPAPSHGPTRSPGPDSSYGAAISGVVNPSAATGGTMTWDLTKKN